MRREDSPDTDNEAATSTWAGDQLCLAGNKDVQMGNVVYAGQVLRLGGGYGGLDT